MSSQVTYEPGSDNVLSIVSAAKTGTTAYIAFSTDEKTTVGDVTSDCTGEDLWEEVSVNAAQTYFVYRYLMGEQTDTANCVVRGVLIDEVDKLAEGLLKVKKMFQ